jgi:hypothetical protein
MIYFKFKILIKILLSHRIIDTLGILILIIIQSENLEGQANYIKNGVMELY